CALPIYIFCATMARLRREKHVSSHARVSSRPDNTCMPGMGAIMEQRRLPAAEQVQVAERVPFQDGRWTVAGHVSRKGRTYASVVTDDGTEMRVPSRRLSRVPGTPRKHVQSRTETMRARCHAGDRVRFAVGTAVLHGTLSRVNPRYAHV